VQNNKLNNQDTISALADLQSIEMDTEKIESDLSYAFSIDKPYKYLSEDSNIFIDEVMKRFDQFNIIRNENVFDCVLSRKLSQTQNVVAAIVSTGRGMTWQQALADGVLNYSDYNARINELSEQNNKPK